MCGVHNRLFLWLQSFATSVCTYIIGFQVTKFGTVAYLGERQATVRE